MFSFDFPEIVIIFGIALVVLGPKKLPGAAAQIGRWVGRARAMARQFREQLEQEVGSVESSLDLRKAMDPSTEHGSTESASSNAATADSPTPGPAAAGEHAGTEGHAAAGAPTAELAPGVDHLADAGHTAAVGERLGESAAGAQAELGEPHMDWPESAGGWSPDSLIAASTPGSAIEEPAAAIGPDSPSRHPESAAVLAHSNVPGGAREGATAETPDTASDGAEAARSEPAAVEHGR